MSARLCHTEIVPVGHNRQVEKPDNVCQKCLVVAGSHKVVQADLADKIENNFVTQGKQLRQKNGGLSCKLAGQQMAVPIYTSGLTDCARRSLVTYVVLF
jgi:hypothetical protein